MQIPVRVKIKLTDVGKKKVAEDIAAIMQAVHETAAAFPETVTDPDYIQILQQVDLAAIELHLSMANSAVAYDSLRRSFPATYYPQPGKLIIVFKPMLCFRGADVSKINAYRLFKNDLCYYLRKLEKFNKMSYLYTNDRRLSAKGCAKVKALLDDTLAPIYSKLEEYLLEDEYSFLTTIIDFNPVKIILQSDLSPRYADCVAARDDIVRIAELPAGEIATGDKRYKGVPFSVLFYFKAHPDNLADLSKYSPLFITLEKLTTCLEREFKVNHSSTIESGPLKTIWLPRNLNYFTAHPFEAEPEAAEVLDVTYILPLDDEDLLPE